MFPKMVYWAGVFIFRIFMMSSSQADNSDSTKPTSKSRAGRRAHSGDRAAKSRSRSRSSKSSRSGRRSRGSKKAAAVSASMATALAETAGRCDAVQEQINDLKRDVEEVKDYPAPNSDSQSPTPSYLPDYWPTEVELLQREADRHQGQLMAQRLSEEDGSHLDPKERAKAMIRQEIELLINIEGPTKECLKNVQRRLRNWVSKYKLDDYPDFASVADSIVQDVFKRRCLNRWTLTLFPKLTAAQYVNLEGVIYTYLLFGFVLTSTMVWIDLGVGIALSRPPWIWHLLVLLASIPRRAYTFVLLYVFAMLVIRPVVVWFKKKSKAVIRYNDVCHDVCCKLQNMPEHAGKFTPSRNPHCEAKTIKLGFSITPNVWIPRSCTHNLERAILKRQLLPSLGTKTGRSEAWDEAFQLFTYNMNPHGPWASAPVVPDDVARQMYLEHLPSKKKAAFQRLLDVNAVREIPVPGERECKSKIFVKREWTTAKVVEKMDPRLISGKTDEYLFHTAPQFYAFQKSLCKQFWSNEMSCAELVTGKKYLYPGGVSRETLGGVVSYFEELGFYAYEGDFSRYDGRTESEALEAEMRLYKSAGLHKQTLDLLCMQIGKTVGTAGLTKFVVPGKRASGVVNTTMGNTLCGFMALTYAIQDMTDVFIIQLGDDNVIFSRRKLNVAEIIKRCEKLGHKLEMVERGNTQDSYDQLEFCSQIFWDVGTQRVLAFKPFRTLAKTFLPNIDLKESHIMGHIAGVAAGYRHYFWVPVLGEVCRNFLRRNYVGRVWSDWNPHKMAAGELMVEVDELSVRRHFIAKYSHTPEEFLAAFDGYDFTRPATITSHILDFGLQIDDVFSNSVPEYEFGNAYTAY